ncbi:hypothetical protein BDQ17DRAFT_1430338 [Cyathus striatus]|nr:hypothetical protein BDQ17DRAFT_1430338 [Cyathus striatus]
MPPKTHRGSSNQLRSHSRSSSSTKLGTNLQFTQKDFPPSKHTEKGKKNGYANETHVKGAPAFARVNSSQRVQSKEQLYVLTGKRPQQPQQYQKANGTKPKAGFTISSPGEDDDDEWVSSESGAATPSHPESDSETDIEELVLTQNHPQRTPQILPQDLNARPETPIPRVDTARPSQFDAAALAAGLTAAQYQHGMRSPLPTFQPTQVSSTEQANVYIHTPRSEADVMTTSYSDSGSNSRNSPRSSNKRHSVTRPPSTHSIASRTEHALRPHPLIRGHSYGHINKPTPLAPLTVIPQATLSQTSTSPSGTIHEGSGDLSTSPSSVRTSLASPRSTETLPSMQGRRTSISSAHSIATIPVHSSLLREQSKGFDRNRTLSSVSSSAALSSLAHLPTVTRPPSPQQIAFFPPTNPHANIEGIHPLLPAPYLNNHLTVLSRRIPIRESFDRVLRAKQALRS